MNKRLIWIIVAAVAACWYFNKNQFGLGGGGHEKYSQQGSWIPKPCKAEGLAMMEEAKRTQTGKKFYACLYKYNYCPQEFKSYNRCLSEVVHKGLGADYCDSQYDALKHCLDVAKKQRS